jgi:aryl-alcohol dehydrogenase-like predicted oxidoreductase
MRTQRLGSAGPELTVIGFGAWEAGGAQWGTPRPEDEVVGAIRAVLDTEINWIDTAEVYGQGRSEELVGRAIAGHRDDLLLASKVAPAPHGSGFRAADVRRACEASLRRLGTDRIDLYQLHWPDEEIPVEEPWGAMASLVDDGLVRWIGVSNFDRPLIERCEAIRHVDSLQQEFNMVQRSDADLLRWCGESGTGVVTYGPLAYGLLTGTIDMSATFGEDDHRSRPESPLAPDRRHLGLAVVDAMRPVAERVGCTLAQLALAWNVRQPGVTSAIAGSTNARHVVANAEADAIDLDAATLAELDRAAALADG